MARKKKIGRVHKKGTGNTKSHVTSRQVVQPNEERSSLYCPDHHFQHRNHYRRQLDEKDVVEDNDDDENESKSNKNNNKNCHQQEEQEEETVEDDDDDNYNHITEETMTKKEEVMVRQDYNRTTEEDHRRTTETTTGTTAEKEEVMVRQDYNRTTEEVHRRTTETMTKTTTEKEEVMVRQDYNRTTEEDHHRTTGTTTGTMTEKEEVMVRQDYNRTTEEDHRRTTETMTEMTTEKEEVMVRQDYNRTTEEDHRRTTGTMTEKEEVMVQQDYKSKNKKQQEDDDDDDKEPNDGKGINKNKNEKPQYYNKKENGTTTKNENENKKQTGKAVSSTIKIRNKKSNLKDPPIYSTQQKEQHDEMYVKLDPKDIASKMKQLLTKEDLEELIEQLGGIVPNKNVESALPSRNLFGTTPREFIVPTTPPPYTRSKYMQHRIDSSLEMAEVIPYDPHAFETTKTGTHRKPSAARMACLRQVRKIDNAVNNNQCTKAQVSLALLKFMEKEENISVAKSAGLLLPSNTLPAIKAVEQHQKMLLDAASTNKKKGRAKDMKRAFAFSDIVCAVETPDSTPPTKKQRSRSKASLVKILPFSKSQSYRIISKAEKKRLELRRNPKASWKMVKPRHGYSKVSDELKSKLQEWVVNHPQIVVSPIVRDTLKLPDPNDPIKTIEFPKLLRMVSVRELHNDLLSDPPTGLDEAKHPITKEALISDTAFRRLLPSNLKPMTERYKQMCGCEICIIISDMQMALNNYRSRHLRKLKQEAEAYADTPDCDAQRISRQRFLRYENEVNPEINGKRETLHLKAKDALKTIQCQPVVGCSVPHLKCQLGTCDHCPTYTFFQEERLLAEEPGQEISFQVYKLTANCTTHGIQPSDNKYCHRCAELEDNKKGKFWRRKMLTKLSKDIVTFLQEYYLPMLKKYAYHLPQVKLLGKNETGRDRKAALKPGDVESTRDYAERVKFEFNHEIQSEHFGFSRALSIEGASVRFFPKDVDTTVMHFHSHFSDGNLQNAATTYSHMDLLLSLMLEDGVLKLGGEGFWFDNTDGCGKQYRCGNSIHLLSALSMKHNITIDRAIGAPGHGKDLVDGLNAVDKRFLKTLMWRPSAPDDDADDDRKIKAHAAEGDTFTSLAVVAASHCSSRRTYGVKGGKKHAKRENAAVMKERQYHVRSPDDPLYDEIHMKCIGFKKDSPGSGLNGMYHLHFDPDLGIGQAAVRRIPCACNACEMQKREPWVPGVAAENQNRFKQNRECQYWPISEGLNDWVIVRTVTTKRSNTNQLKRLQAEVLEAVTERMAKVVKAGSYVAMPTEDLESRPNGYFVMKIMSDCYKDDTGEWVVNACDMIPVGGTKSWYTPSIDEETIYLQHIVQSELKLVGEGDGAVLPNNCNKQAAREMGALKLSEIDDEKTKEEIKRRGGLEFQYDDLLEEEACDDEEDGDEEEGDDPNGEVVCYSDNESNNEESDDED